MAVVTFEDERTKLQANVRPATYSDDLRRLDMQQSAASKSYASSGEMVASVYTVPRLICATPSGELTLDGVKTDWPPTFEQLFDMSSGAVNAWLTEVKRLNPTWFPNDDELKKMMEMKPPTELSGS